MLAYLFNHRGVLAVAGPGEAHALGMFVFRAKLEFGGTQQVGPRIGTTWEGDLHSEVAAIIGLLVGSELLMNCRRKFLSFCLDLCLLQSFLGAKWHPRLLCEKIC